VKYGTAVSGNGGTVAVQVWRNVDPRFIWLKKDNMPYATASTTSTARPDPPTLTPVYSKSIILAAGGTGHTRGASTFTSSDLSNFITIGANQTVDATVGLGSYTWTSGSFDPAQFGFSGSDSAAYGNCSVTLAIPPKNSVTSELNSIIATTQNKRTTSGTTLVLQKPASVQENDLMVMTVFDNGSLTRTMSATGWTSAYARAGSGNLTIFYKTAGASEPSSYTITSSGSAVLTGTFMAFRGYQWDTIGTANTTSSTSMTANSITVGANDSWLIGVASSQAEMLGVTGIGEPLDYVFNSVYDLVSRSAHTVTGEKVNSGTSPSTTYSFPASSNNMVILFSVKPV
jgi:hypothetical protein